jgi:hypothetical protein
MDNYDHKPAGGAVVVTVKKTFQKLFVLYCYFFLFKKK